jgi:hypothetical protein
MGYFKAAQNLGSVEFLLCCRRSVITLILFSRKKLNLPISLSDARSALYRRVSPYKIYREIVIFHEVLF